MRYDAPLTDEERFPLLGEEGRKLLLWMWEHPHAPRYNFKCGDRLTGESLQRVRDYETELNTSHKGWALGEPPDWAKEFARRSIAEVPFYRRRGGAADSFDSIPTFSRAELKHEPWSFVPDSQRLDELIVYYTSGTTGQRLNVLSHPEVSSIYLPALRAALATRNVKLEGGIDRVSIITVCAQASTFTYASVSSFLDGAGFVKINLNPNDWREMEDCVKFLDSCNSEIYTGDPISFVALAKLPLKTRPKALVSTAMTLLPGLQKELEEHFRCPVIDVYSMTEARMIAVRTDRGYEVIPHDLYVEILDAEGNLCPPGVRGEVTLTGGPNPFLPLLRYRTGDYAAMEFDGAKPLLVDFEGRPPTLFLNSTGKIVNNIDVSYELREFPIAQFALHQNQDRSLVFRLNGNVDRDEIRQALLNLFGTDQLLVIKELTEEEVAGGKVIQYTSDIQDVSVDQSEIEYPATSN
jgi:phenylacetate-CoA ligase